MGGTVLARSYVAHGTRGTHGNRMMLSSPGIVPHRHGRNNAHRPQDRILIGISGRLDTIVIVSYLPCMRDGTREDQPPVAEGVNQKGTSDRHPSPSRVVS